MIHSSKAIIIFIVAAGLFGTAVLLKTVKTAVRVSNAATVQHDVWVGDILPQLPGYSWGEHDHSLVVALRAECVHCKASVPFYRQLQSIVGGSTSQVGVVAIFSNPVDKVREFLDRFALKMPAIPGMPLDRLAVSGTPTLILADSRGIVIRVWVGELDAGEQRELLAQVRSYLGGKER